MSCVASTPVIFAARSTTHTPPGGASCRLPARRPTLRTRRVVLRAAEETTTTETVTSAEEAPAAEPVPAAAAAVAAEPASTGFLSPIQETINGRLSMLGFASAVAVELSTGKSIGQQLFTQKMVTGVPTLGFDLKEWTVVMFCVLSITLASLAPGFISDEPEKEKDRSFGPFTPSAELANGRTAMMGIFTLLLAERVMNHALF
eukprot:CAMPEP_0170143612 /NCGR_PEP_ID=MMETSP0033_2-20121228/11961_1 /TAXON_ID=195969 /ORGANISM="Dolichomastix tenuilepis, Strain CCMP3274" /LENGTH=202 /DNA_ID=CAMNT_0010380071 /DNA_START=14 /DNA_END=622 /DNA_ORIENTATION=+